MNGWFYRFAVRTKGVKEWVCLTFRDADGKLFRTRDAAMQDMFRKREELFGIFFKVDFDGFYHYQSGRFVKD